MFHFVRNHLQSTQGVFRHTAKKYLTLGTLAKGVMTHLGVDFVLDFAESDF